MKQKLANCLFIYQNLLRTFYFTPQKSDHVLLLSVTFYYFHHRCLVIFCVKPRKVCKILNTHHSNGLKPFKNEYLINEMADIGF